MMCDHMKACSKLSRLCLSRTFECRGRSLFPMLTHGWIQGLLLAVGFVATCCERFLLGCTGVQRQRMGSRAGVAFFEQTSAGLSCTGTGCQCLFVPSPSRGTMHFAATMRLRGGSAKRLVTLEVCKRRRVRNLLCCYCCGPQILADALLAIERVPFDVARA
jgi:hypothetical protein